MTADLRSTRLKTFYFAVADGKRGIRTFAEAKLFLDAVCDQRDQVQCISMLLSRKHALQAVHRSLCMDLSDEFLDGPGAQCIQHLVNETTRLLNGGQLLRDLLQTILEPPLFWNALKDAASLRRLSTDGLRAFARLVLELLIILPPTSELQSSLELKSAARSILESEQLLESPIPDLRSIGYEMQAAIHSLATSEQQLDHLSNRPGGRHDNDFEEFRKIAIFPTRDELLSKELPFILPAESVLSVAPGSRVAMHLDNQFRLLREDMLAELREDLKRATTSAKVKKRGLTLRGMQLSGIETGNSSKLKSAAMTLRCFDAAAFRSFPEDEELRKKYVTENKNFIKHGSFGCLMIGSDVVAFATVDRDEDLLAKRPPVLLLQVFGHVAIRTALLTLKIKKPHEIDFVMIDTPFFAYEPILTGLQSMSSLPLAESILNIVEGGTDTPSSLGLDTLAGAVSRLEGCDLENVLKLPHEIRLDKPQTESFIAGLTQAVSLVQGPPGTGKSFIGAILTKAFLECTKETILVLCYTNHALDQFLEDILNMGVVGEDMLRLGSKSTARTRPLTLFEQTGKRARLSPEAWRLRQNMLQDAEDSSSRLQDCGRSFSKWKCADKDLLESLEFADEDMKFFNALSVPERTDGMITVGASGEAVGAWYLLDRWRQGRNAGVFQATVGKIHSEVWDMPLKERAQYYARWVKNATLEQVDVLSDTMQQYDKDYQRWTRVRDEKTIEVMKTKRLVGCTTTAAAKYARQIASANPGIVLVEEAGEVLESHILTALSRNTKQMVLIGDHLQLRPKVNNFALTVEKGDGYDLNRSLFERLVTGGHRHTVLTKQHRMRPQISTLVRRLMYPELADSDTTLSRPDIRGLQSNVIFFDHTELELSDERLKDRADGESKMSRQNPFEAKMVLKIVRYLAQQGYGTEQQVVLTPYLGQLRLLIDNLKNDHDPVLGDLDSHDLLKAGLLTAAAANLTKRQLRVSTIDNFQGEERDIVIVSLTRSNKKGDIGFLNAPQRLNVLLSRARNGLIIIGNASTFRNSKKGRETWDPFFTQLIRAGQFFDGFPVQCEQHADRKAMLRVPEDFDAHCPNGGCELPCGAMLKCGKHQCPEKCHQLADHSKMQCKKIETSQCVKGHQIMWECYQRLKPCSTCDRLQKDQEARQARDLKLSKRREEKEKAYLEQIQAIDAEIADQRRLVQERSEDANRKIMLDQKKADLAQAQKMVQEKQVKKPVQGRETAQQPQHEAVATKMESRDVSGAAAQWEHQKATENVRNEHIDSLMAMIGLESVKRQVLEVKDKIDTALRQGASLERERFGLVLLGNPGTGKTTVARLYAKCLASMGAVAGNTAEETTASRLTSMGVPGFKKLVEKTLNSGGGAVFIDEAYQLATGMSAGGSQILDALLDEAEILVGKVIFILAGYKQEMENVFSHNPGLPSRFPHEFVFEDYQDNELLHIFRKLIRDRFQGRMKVEGGDDGLFCRIVARRVGYGRGRPGFGNARAVENSFTRICSRQAARISCARRSGQTYDDFLLTKEDLIGPEPSSALESSEAWAELKSLIGLKAVKNSVDALMQSVRYNYERELREEARVDFNLNRVFLGSPGTGKTTVAKLYGKILADLGLLSNGLVVVKNPSDFVGDALGVSEKNTRGILASTVGKVLVIDEAYGLYSGSSTASQSEDPYKTAIIDTLVAEVQSVPGEDRCVLLLGYRNQMESMLQKVNPGLSRRFPMSDAFTFEDFADDELEQIVKLKLRQQAFTVTQQAMDTIMAVLQRARNKSNFGNAGEVDIILNSAKIRHQKRQRPDSIHSAIFEAEDIDPDFDRVQKKNFSARALFEGTFGNDELISRLEKIQKTARNMKERGLNPRDQIPFNFVFLGPPGTGKTTTARKMGKIYYDIGILASEEVVEISATELIGQYIGQTGPKTQQQLEKALGKVLFVDEAYRLAEGPFAKEAIDEIVDRLTKPEFAQRLIVILAGYDHDIERLLRTNAGLRSRFPESVAFHSLPPRDCMKLLISKLAQTPFLDVSSLQAPRESFIHEAGTRFQTLIQQDDWANARDVETLAKGIARDQLYNDDSTSKDLLIVTEQDVLTALDEVVEERQQRAQQFQQASVERFSPDLLLTKQHQDMQILDRAEPLDSATVTSKVSHDRSCNMNAIDESADAATSDTRDAGVSDEVWARLEVDKREAAERDQHYEDTVARQNTLEQEHSAEDHIEPEFVDDRDTESPEDMEERLRREQERVAQELSRRQREEEIERLRRERIELEMEREKERKAQKKLRNMGVCVMGFRWIKQNSGYRCAGGSHFVPNSALT